jgi:RNA polymerase sigma-70 factor, ECF subfamily
MALSSRTQLIETTYLCEQTGKTINLEALVKDHRAYIFKLCLSILNEEAEAEDITQETFVAALHGLKNFRGDSNVRTWLSAITINLCRDLMRKRKARRTLYSALQNLPLIDENPPAPEETYLQTETFHLLWAAVQRLNEKHRLPVLLRYAHNLPTAEIAQILDLTEGTVHSRLHYARKKLQGDLHRASRTHSKEQPAGSLP